MRRVLSWMMALCITSAASVSISASETVTYRDIAMYFIGKGSEGEYDVNHDNRIDIIDVILTKQNQLQQNTPDMDQTENLNTAAMNIYNEAKELALEFKAKKTALPDIKISSEDENDFSVKLNRQLETKYGYSGLKWSVRCSGDKVSSAVCTMSEKNTGAYPSAVPAEMNIPYDKNHVFNAEEKDFDWNTAFCNTADLNEYAQEYMCNAQSYALEFKNKGKELKDGIITSEDESEFSDLVSCMGLFESPKYLKWAVLVRNYRIQGVICTDASQNKTGAFPDTIPQNLDIPFDNKNTYLASDSAYDWKNDFAGFISSDPERAVMPDYPEVPDKMASVNAVLAFNMINQEISIIKAEDPDFVIADGTYDTDQYYGFPQEILDSSRMTRFIVCKKGVHYVYVVKDNKVVSLKYYDANASKVIDMDNDILQKLIQQQ